MIELAEQLPPGVREEIQEQRPRYLKTSQLALYASLESLEKMNIFTKSSYDVQGNVVFCFEALKYDSDIREELTLLIIRTLDEEVPKLKNKFSIAYIHNSLTTFLYLRSVLRLLPEPHLTRLHRIYLVQTGLMVRLVEKFSFGAMNAFFSSKTEHLNNPEEIQTTNKILLGGSVTKSKLKQMAETAQGPKHRLTHESDASITQVIQNKLYGKELEAYERSEQGLPLLIERLVVRLYSSQQFLEAEGIMRKSCDVEQLEILQNAIIDGQGEETIRNFDSPYVLCGCLKKIFNNLYTPLFSFELYEEIISYRSDGQKDNDLYFTKTCINKMRKLNRQVLLYMLSFLKYGIMANQENNKMTAHNLAVVFGPCFFRPKEYRLEALMYSGKFSVIIKMLLEELEALSGSEGEYYRGLLEKQKAQYLKQNK